MAVMKVINLPERLRDLAETLCGCQWNHPLCSPATCNEAADEIERLRAESHIIKTALSDIRNGGTGKGAATIALKALFEAAKAAREHTAQVKNCTTCRSLVGCEEARGGGQEGFTCWKPRKEKH